MIAADRGNLDILTYLVEGTRGGLWGCGDDIRDKRERTYTIFATESSYEEEVMNYLVEQQVSTGACVSLTCDPDIENC
jgi:hypothetical protein